MRLMFTLGLCLLLIIIPIASTAEGETRDSDLKPKRIPRHEKFAILLRSSVDSTFAQGLLMGEDCARELGAGKESLSQGVVLGLLLGLVGTGLAMGLSQEERKPPLSNILALEAKNADYQTGFLEGYQRQANSSALSDALFGGLIGTTVTVFVVVLVASNQE